MKGSISEFELGVLRARMFEAERAKAQHGELRVSLPIGYVWHREIGLGFDPDVRLQEAIRLIFVRFRKLGSARQVFLSLAGEQVHFPRPSDDKKMVTFDWTPIRNRPDLVFDPIVVSGQLPVIHEARQRSPAPKAVIQGLGSCRAVRQLLSLQYHPLVQCIEHGLGVLLPNSLALIGTQFLDLALNVVNLAVMTSIVSVCLVIYTVLCLCAR